MLASWCQVRETVRAFVVSEHVRRERNLIVRTGCRGVPALGASARHHVARLNASDNVGVIGNSGAPRAAGCGNTVPTRALMATRSPRFSARVAAPSTATADPWPKVPRGS